MDLTASQPFFFYSSSRVYEITKLESESRSRQYPIYYTTYSGCKVLEKLKEHVKKYDFVLNLIRIFSLQKLRIVKCYAFN